MKTGWHCFTGIRSIVKPHVEVLLINLKILKPHFFNVQSLIQTAGGSTLTFPPTLWCVELGAISPWIAQKMWNSIFLKATLLEWFHTNKYVADPMGDRVDSLEMGVSSCLQLRPKSSRNVPSVSKTEQKIQHNIQSTREWDWESVFPSFTSLFFSVV